MTTHRIVVKLGSSTLTSGEGQINRQRMLEIVQQIVQQVARLRQAGHEMVVVRPVFDAPSHLSAFWIALRTC